jgi:T-complex protein 1 subunit delta
MGQTVTVLMRGSNKLVLDEADRSIHDALCVVRSLVKKRYMIAGGGAGEAECALRLTQWSKTLTGVRAYCARSFAEVRSPHPPLSSSPLIARRPSKSFHTP